MKIIIGNIFSTPYQTIVNSINCTGVMGAGIALECRLRYPEMYSRYVELCDKKLIDIGKLWIYKVSDRRWILNFPTKKHWKYNSKLKYLEKGLQKFLATYKDKGISSIAFPLLGADKGGIPEERSLETIKKYLLKCDIPIEIYKYDPTAKDDLYENFKQIFFSSDINELPKLTGINKRSVVRIKVALENPEIQSIIRLSTIHGIGLKTLEKCYKYIMDNNKTNKGSRNQNLVTNYCA